MCSGVWEPSPLCEKFIIAAATKLLWRRLGRDGLRSRGVWPLWMLRVYQRGPIAYGIDAVPVLNWELGCISTAGSGIDNVISVVGWGKDAGQGQNWIVRK